MPVFHLRRNMLEEENDLLCEIVFKILAICVFAFFTLRLKLGYSVRELARGRWILKVSNQKKTHPLPSGPPPKSLSQNTVSCAMSVRAECEQEVMQVCRQASRPSWDCDISGPYYSPARATDTVQAFNLLIAVRKENFND